LGRLKVHGFDKPQVVYVGAIKVYLIQTPTIHGHSRPRDAQTFPISQFKLEAALFETTFLFEQIVLDESMFQKDEIW